MQAFEKCQAKCEDPAALRSYSAVAWSLILSIPDYKLKWDQLRELFGDDNVESLADLTAEQVRQLLNRLGIEARIEYGSDFYQSDVTEELNRGYEFSLQNNGYSGTGSQTNWYNEISQHNGWDQVLQWISELTEVQEDAVDDEIDVCYERCSEENPMVFSFDATAEGFPELDMWVSTVLKQNVNFSDAKSITKAVEAELKRGYNDPNFSIHEDTSSQSGGTQQILARRTDSSSYRFTDLVTVHDPEKAEHFAQLLQQHMPIPALQDEIANFADNISATDDVGLYYVGADSWSLSVATVAACSIKKGVKFAHLDMGQRPHYASYTRGLPSVMLSSCSFHDLDLCLYDWDESGLNHPVPCCHAAVYRAWPLCESPLWSVDRLKDWITSALPPDKVIFQKCPIIEKLPFLFSGYEDRQYAFYCKYHVPLSSSEPKNEKFKVEKKPKKKKRSSWKGRRKIWVPDIGWVIANDSSSEGGIVLVAILLGTLTFYFYKMMRYTQVANKKIYRRSNYFVSNDEKEKLFAGVKKPATLKKKTAKPKKQKKRNRILSIKETRNVEQEDEKKREIERRKEKERVEAFERREELRQAKLREEFDKSEIRHGSSKKKKKKQITGSISLLSEKRDTCKPDIRSSLKEKATLNSVDKLGNFRERSTGEETAQTSVNYVAHKNNIGSRGNNFHLKAPTDAQRAEASRRLGKWQAEQLSKLLMAKRQKEMLLLASSSTPYERNGPSDSFLEDSEVLNLSNVPNQPQLPHIQLYKGESYANELLPNLETGNAFSNNLSSHSAESDVDYHFTFSLPDILDDVKDSERIEINSADHYQHQDTCSISNSVSLHNPWNQWPDNKGCPFSSSFDVNISSNTIPWNVSKSNESKVSLEETAAVVFDSGSAYCIDIRNSPCNRKESSPHFFKNPLRSAGLDSDPVTELQEMLASLNLSHLCNILENNEVDMDSLKLMGENDLKEMGIAKGPRIKIMTRVKSDLFGFDIGTSESTMSTGSCSESLLDGDF